MLKERGRGVYAGPLRMLAQEAHRRLSAELGEDAVGLVTGEERINDGAPIICCTVEMAPSSGEVLVLDEVQWADDPERGSAWTRLLLAGEYRHILLLGALDAEPLVLRAFPEAEIKVFERMLPLEFVGERSLRRLTPGTVVVAFSRKAVLALAGEINRLHPGRVVRALRGHAARLAARGDRPLPQRRLGRHRRDRRARARRQPARARRCCSPRRPSSTASRGATCCRGSSRRSRAGPGRFGLVERGHVGVLTGVSWASADPAIVESALQPHVELPSGHLGYRIVDEARIRPRLSDLGVDDPRRLDAALAAWHRVATRAWALRELARRRVAAARSAAGSPRSSVASSSATAGSRSRTRGSSSTRRSTRTTRELLATLALAVAGDTAQRSLLTFLLDPARLRDATLEEAEQAGRTASILRWFALQYPGVGGVTIERAAALEEAAAARVVPRLRVEVERSRRSAAAAPAGSPCAPWFPLCDRCFGRAGGRPR